MDFILSYSLSVSSLEHKFFEAMTGRVRAPRIFLKYLLFNLFIWLKEVLVAAWDLLPWPGVEPGSPALGAGVLSTRSPGRSLLELLLLLLLLYFLYVMPFLPPVTVFVFVYIFIYFGWRWVLVSAQASLWSAVIGLLSSWGAWASPGVASLGAEDRL